MKRVFRIILFFGFFATAINAQPPFYSHWNIRQGLPSDIIYDLGKDSDDYLYLGTELGLYRFNGIRFQAIPFLGHRSVSVTSIILDNSKTLWCRNFSNQIFYLHRDTMRYYELPNHYLKKSENILDIKPYQNGICILTSGKLIYASQQSVHIIAELNVLEDFIIINNKDLYFINSDGFVYRYLDGEVTFMYQMPPNKYRLAVYHGKPIAVPKINENQEIWELKDNEPELMLTFPDKKTSYINTVSSNQEFLYLATNNGLKIFDGRKWIFVAENARVSDVISDFQGNMWISSLDNGLYMIPDLQVRFVKENDEQSRFTSIAYSLNGIYAGTKDGFIYEIDHAGNVLKTFDTRIRNEIEYIHYDKVKGHLYCSQGVFLNGAPKQFFPYYFGKNIQFDTYGNVYFSVHNQAGLYQLSPNPDFSIQGLEFESNVLPHYIFKKERSRCIYYDTITNNLWIGYASELVLRKPTGEEFFIKDKSGKPLYSTSIVSDPKGRIWVSTIQNGIYCFDDTLQLANITTKSGLSGSLVRKLVSSPSHLYAITDNGVDKIDLNFMTVNSLSRKAGLHQLGWIDAVYQKQGLFVVTGSGIIYVPDTITKQEILPKVWITKTPSDLYQGTGNVFKYQQNYMQFAWNILSFRQGSSVLGYYRLLPRDSVFHQISMDVGSVSFSSLSYGNYRFEFVVPDANYSYIYSFTIKKPFWLSSWFIVAESILFVLILIVVLRITKGRIRKKQILKEKLIYSQLTALRAQMNPHFIYNILNSIQGLVYGGLKEEAAENIGLFSDMMRKVLDVSSKQYITLHDEIEMLRLYILVEKLRMPDLQFVIDIDKRIDLFKTQIPSMIIQPLVENAIKHGLYHKQGDKQLNVYISKKSDLELQIAVSDNGIGRKKSADLNKKRRKHVSFSTQAIDSRIHLFNELGETNIQLEVIDKFENEQSLGTTVLVYITSNHNASKVHH